MIKGKHLRISGLIAATAGIAGLAFLLAACPTQLADVDLKQQIQGEVTVATARVLNLTIENDSNGLTTPSGLQSVKEGVPLALAATAFTTHVFDHWEVVSSNGPVNIANTSSASSTLTLLGGNAVVRAVFEARPRVLYSRPVGNDIALNSRVSIVFSKLIDVSSANFANISIKKYGSTPIEGSFSSSDSSTNTTVLFTPDAPLSKYSLYVVEVLKTLTDRKGNTMTDMYTNPFQTGATSDSVPPSNGTFTISGSSIYPSTNPTHTGSEAIQLDGINADDDSGVAEILIRNEVNDYSGATSYMYSVSKPWFVSTGDGLKTIYMWLKDAAGNQTNQPDPATDVFKTITLDRTPPNGSIVIDEGPQTANNTVGLTLSATDASSGITAPTGKMWISNNSDFSSGSWEDYATTKSGWPLLNPTTDGNKTIYIVFRDNVGNVSPTYSSSIYLDKTGPTGSLTLAGGGLSTGTAAVTFAINVSDRAGMSQMRVASGLAPSTAWSTASPVASGTSDGTGATAWTGSGTDFSGLLVDTEGNKTVTFEFKDVLGNVASVPVTVKLDKTAPPSLNCSILINSGATSTNNPAVTLSLSASDNAGGSGVTQMQFSNDNSTWSDWVPYAAYYGWTLPAPDALNKPVYVRFMDAAGNQSASISDTIKLDTTPPGGGFTIAGGATYATSTIVTLNNAMTGATQMVFSNTAGSFGGYVAYASSYYPWTMTAGDGTKTVYGRFSDGTTPVDRSDTIILDSTSPTGTITILGTGDGSNAYTNNLSVNLSLAASDALSGMSQMQFSNTNNGTDWSTPVAYGTSAAWTLTAGAAGTRTVYVRYKDVAGNYGIYSDTIYYDATLPTATISINAGAIYATSAAATLTLTGTDANSGIFEMSYSQDLGTTWTSWEPYPVTNSKLITLLSTNGTRYVDFRVRDRAGNISSTVRDSIYLDTIAPTGYFYIGGSGNPTSATTLNTTLYLYVSDNASGLYQQRFSNDGSTWTAWEADTTTRSWTLTPINGVKTVYAQFKDYAGNISGTITDGISLASTYASITYADIVAADSLMSTASINLAGPAPNTIIVYKTGAGRYGKFTISNFVAQQLITALPLLYWYNVITFPSIVYNSGGSTYLSETGSMYGGTTSTADSTYDLDAGAMSTSILAATDFVWQNSSTAAHYLAPNGAAKFLRWQ